MFMARDEDWQERQRRRRREDEADEQTKTAIQTGNLSQVESGQLQENLEVLFQRAENLLEQVNSLYQMYFSGIEKRAPIERRKQLDQVMYTLTTVNKGTAAQRFKFTTVQSKYNTFKDRWERTEKDIESGKIKRPAGPKK